MNSPDRSSAGEGRGPVTTRPATGDDVELLAELYTESVHGIAWASYSAEQLNAWAPRPPELEKWRNLLSGLQTLIAMREGVAAGFLSYSDEGHIALLFTSPAAKREGIATLLFRRAEEALRARGVEELFTEASLEARPFFERQGFEFVEEEIVERRGVLLRRFAMRRKGRPGSEAP